MMVDGFLEFGKILPFVFAAGHERLDGCELGYEFVVVAAVVLVFVPSTTTVVPAIEPRSSCRCGR